MSDDETTLRRKIVGIIVRLDLCSHVSAKDYDAASSARDTSESPGGKKPSHGGQDHPRGMEVVDFRESYELHSADHFRRRLAKASSEKALRAILADAEDALAAWQRSPAPPEGFPPPRSDSKFKRWVVESPRSSADIARLTQCSRQYIAKIRKDFGKGES